MKLLLADDEQELTAALKAVLTRSGFSVDTVYDGEQALDYIAPDEYDGIILDIMMPKRDGIAVLTEIRRQGISTPVMLLTARSEVEDRISGLDAGADDYLPKPFHMGEFVARVRALTRRRAEGFVPDTIRLGNTVLDRSAFVLKGPDGSLDLPNKEFQMLELLFSSGGRCLPTERFMTRIWGYDSDADSSVVWVYISYLRRKLEAVGSNLEIRVARGRGYTLGEKTT